MRPYLRSPTMATERPSRPPSSRRMVYRSRRACVGCSPAPSPAFTTGTSTASAARFAPPVSPCLMTMQSAYPASMRAVSTRVSPLAVDDEEASATVTVRAPRRWAAASKDRRVRVEGSRKSTATIFLESAHDAPRPVASRSMERAVSRMRRISERDRSRVESRSLPASGKRPGKEPRTYSPSTR